MLTLICFLSFVVGFTIGEWKGEHTDYWKKLETFLDKYNDLRDEKTIKRLGNGRNKHH